MTIRLFRWSDLDGYAGVVAAGGRPYTAGLAEEYLRQPNLSPERDCFVVEGDGRFDGFTLVVPEPVLGRVILEGAVRPDARGRGHGRALLAAALDHGRALRANIAHISALPDQTDALRLFRAAGFEEVKRQWQMRLELNDFALREVDTSYETAEMRPGEESIMTALQNAAFGESWGFAPNLPEEITYRVRMAGSTARRRALAPCRRRARRLLLDAARTIAGRRRRAGDHLDDRLRPRQAWSRSGPRDDQREHPRADGAEAPSPSSLRSTPTTTPRWGSTAPSAFGTSTTSSGARRR